MQLAGGVGRVASVREAHDAAPLGQHPRYALPYFFAGSIPGLSWETVDARYGCIIGGKGVYGVYTMEIVVRH